MNSIIDLRCGQLRLSVERADYPLNELCAFGCRRSRRRGFVIVSKVLGKHIPVRPRKMSEIHAKLASKIDDLSGPIVFLALAETAIGLGHAVFENWLARTSRSDAVFLHSTRYRLSRPLAFAFHEPHSHAPDHLVYLPIDPEARNLFLNAKSLVLIDDEVTTGRTLVNLARRYLRLNRDLQNLSFLCLTDWLGPRSSEIAREFGIRVDIVSLLKGNLDFIPNPAFHPAPAADANLRHDNKDSILTKNFGRLGISRPIAYDLPDRIAPSPSTKSTRILVLGTGEFSHIPFRLAQRLECLGHEVYFQSTTRSPLLEGDAIQDVLEFEDNYGDHMPNYLYNARSLESDRVIIGYETAYWPPTHTLPKLLNAEIVIF